MADSFAQRYPHIADWVQDGWIEIGYDDYQRSFARALDTGGMVWEGAESYENMDAALQALEEGIAAWLHEQGEE